MKNKNYVTPSRSPAKEFVRPGFTIVHVKRGKTVPKSVSSNLKVGGKPLSSSVAAGMKSEVVFSDKKTIESFISAVSLSCTEGLDCSQSTVQIVKSLIWPFVCRRSNRNTWFTYKEYGRFLKSWRCTASRIQSHVTDFCGEQTFVKFWLDTYMCQVMGDSQRPQKDPSIRTTLFSGWLKRFVARAISRRDIAFIYSLAKGSKRLWHEPGTLARRKALEGHQKALTSVKKPINDSILATIRHWSSKIFSYLSTNGTKFIPTGSSCLQAPVRKGGTLSLCEPFYLEDFTPLTSIEATRTVVEISKKSPPNVTITHRRVRRKRGSWKTIEHSLPVGSGVSYYRLKELVRENDLRKEVIHSKKREFNFDRHSFLMRKLLGGEHLRVKLGLLRDFELGISSWRKEEFKKVERQALRSLRDKFDFYLTDREPLSNFVGSVSVVTIPEPGKYRIITKGDGYVYTALQPFQGQMLNAWKVRRESTMLHDDLTERVQEIDRNCSVLKYWCSGDYKNATDLLSRHATLAAISGMSNCPGFPLAFLALFSPTLVSYPKEPRVIEDGKEKFPEWSIPDSIANEGQLMGHPLSFPLLCVINLAVYHETINEWCSYDRVYTKVFQKLPGMDAYSKKRATVRRLEKRKKLAVIMRENVLVNGDDILFKCNRSFYSLWLEIVTEVGFQISQGKNYLSPDCCMINSQIFKRSGGVMRREGYLNLKFVSGFSVKTGESLAVPTQIARDVNKMCSLCPWTQGSISAIFKRWSHQVIDNFVPNWYLPVHLGGFGLDPKFRPKSWRISKKQRIVAAHFINDPKLSLYRMTGISLPAIDFAGAICSWKFVDRPSVPRDYEVSDDPWLARIALACRYSQCGQDIDDGDSWYRRPSQSDVPILNRIKIQHRLRPVSDSKLDKYWNRMLIHSPLPQCPDLSSLRYKTVNGDLSELLERTLSRQLLMIYDKAKSTEMNSVIIPQVLRLITELNVIRREERLRQQKLTPMFSVLASVPKEKVIGNPIEFTSWE